MKKLAFLLLVISIPATLLPMKSYSVETGNDQIRCKIQTYTKHQMRLLIGSMLFPTFIMHKENNRKTYYTEHPMDRLPRDYMAIKVYIKNNSDEPIYLTEDYLLGPQEFFVSKQQFLTDHLSKHLNCKSEKIKALALFTVPLIISLLTEVVLLPRAFREVQTTSNYKALQTVRGIVHSISGICSLNGYFWLKNVNLLHTVYTKILCKTFYNHDGIYYYYKHEYPYFEIPPHATFQDIFFVPLKNINRNIFETTNVTLDYTTKPPEQEV